jgi:hypothetical protein
VDIIGMKKMKSGPDGVPGEEQKSHLRRSDAVDKLLAKLVLTTP